VLTQFAACTSVEDWSVMMFCHNNDIGKFQDAFRKYGLSNVDAMFWYKEGYVAEGNKWQLLQAMEVFVLGHMRKSKGSMGYDGVPEDPNLRLNLITMPAVSANERNTYSDGTYVNVCQKPPGLAKWFCDWYMEPEGNVIVGCAGSGGEVRGCLEAGRHVVAVENDSKQTNWMIGFFTQLDASIATLREIADEKEAKSKPKKVAPTADEEDAKETDGKCPSCYVNLFGTGNLLKCDCGDTYCDMCGDRPDSVPNDQKYVAEKCSENCTGAPEYLEKPLENADVPAEDPEEVFFNVFSFLY
jgi:hypothetical protein